jgi:hypothetical protein
MCLKDGRINAATIAHHIEPHKGDQQKFFFGELQSLCSCTTRAPRNARKRAATRLGSAPTAGQSTQGTPYIRGAGGHEIFLMLALNATAPARQACYIFILRRIG